MTGNEKTKPKVVVIGAGFGGLAAVKALKNAPVEIELIDRRNYHLFQPLLYQVASADLSPADIAWPIRSVLSSQKNVTVRMSEVDDIDLKEKHVMCADLDVAYDYLIVATGATHSYFGKDHWAEHAPGLKKIVDATEIRRRVLLAFERAELAETKEEQERQLTFVIVGAGPTGVEMAGAISELANHTLASDFRNISTRGTRVVLVEAGPRVLGAFPQSLSEKSKASLEKLGVDVWLDTMVEDISEQGVLTSEGSLDAATVIWGAGVKVEKMAQWLDCETDRAGRVCVEPDLSLPDHPEVFVVGDAAKVPWRDKGDVPGVAPAAKQGGKFAAKVIKERLAGSDRPLRFKYRHFGNLATIGRNAAIIDFGWFKLSGVLAWWLWGIAHIYFLIGVRQPTFVAMSWLWSYLTYSKGARLITGAKREPHRKPETVLQEL